MSFIIDPKKHQSRLLSWTVFVRSWCSIIDEEALCLACHFNVYYFHLSKVKAPPKLSIWREQEGRENHQPTLIYWPWKIGSEKRNNQSSSIMKPKQIDFLGIIFNWFQIFFFSLLWEIFEEVLQLSESQERWSQNGRFCSCWCAKGLLCKTLEKAFLPINAFQEFWLAPDMVYFLKIIPSSWREKNLFYCSGSSSILSFLCCVENIKRD